MDTTLSSLLLAAQDDSPEVLSAKQHLQAVTIASLLRFITLCAALKNDIAQAQHVSQPRDVVPQSISCTIIEFLSDTLGLSEALVTDMWTVLGRVAWEYSTISGPKAEEDNYAVHGWRRTLGMYTLRSSIV